MVGLLKGKGGHGYGCEGGLGAVASVREPLRVVPALGGRIQLLDFSFWDFRSKRHFRSHRFFSIKLPEHPLNFFVFQNPAVCYFAHIASIAENTNF